MSRSQEAPLVKVLNADKAVVAGTLIGDVIVNQTTIEQYQKAKRKNWRPLSRFHYPTPGLEDDLTGRIRSHLVVQLHRTFRDAGYTEFTSLIATGRIDTPLPVEGEPITGDEWGALELISQHARYTGALASALRLLWSDNPERVAFQEGLNADVRYLSERWRITCGPWRRAGLLAYRFVYDPEAFQISIAPHREVWTNPAQYPEKVGITSELLMLLCAVSKTSLMQLDMATVEQSYPLAKLMMSLLDRRLDWDQVRVNATDPEEWDYVNPEADEAFRAQAAKRIP